MVIHATKEDQPLQKVEINAGATLPSQKVSLSFCVCVSVDRGERALR